MKVRRVPGEPDSAERLAKGKAQHEDEKAIQGAGREVTTEGQLGLFEQTTKYD